MRDVFMNTLVVASTYNQIWCGSSSHTESESALLKRKNDRMKALFPFKSVDRKEEFSMASSVARKKE